MITRPLPIISLEEAEHASQPERPDIQSASCWYQGANALTLLLEGHQLARRLGRDPWDLAVEISDLQQNGLSRNALRWLVCEQYVRHAMEVASAGSGGRTFVFDGVALTLRFTDDTCFILTRDGVSFVSRLMSSIRRQGKMNLPKSSDSETSTVVTTPKWDSLRQELRHGDVIIKRFKVRAPNQERVLSAFEEEGWPPCIDDPLPRHMDLEPKRRLHETINSLNRSQKHRLVRFMGNGKGEGVAWEFTAAEQCEW